jgi:hypothetical protein
MAVLGGLLVFRPTTPRSGARQPGAFATFEEARQYALARILHSPCIDPSDDPYGASFERNYNSLTGTTTRHLLVDEADRERELARGFERHGFIREALTHYANLATIHGDEPARERIRSLQRRTVLGLVEAKAPVFEDGLGNLLVRALRPVPERPTVETIHEPWLPQGFPVPGVLHRIGFVREDGALVAAHGEPEGEGAGSWLVLPPGATTLWAAERNSKADFLDRVPDRSRRVAEACLYLGFVTKARGMLGTVPLPFEDLDALARDTSSPLTLDALWLRQLARHPRLVLTTKSSVTAGTHLPVEVEAHSIDRIAFDFAKLEGPIPTTEAAVKAWLPTAPATASHRETLAVPSLRCTLALPIVQPGAYRVTAEARGLSCTFLAIRADAGVELFVTPAETRIRASGPGFAVSNGPTELGVTDAAGFVVPRPGTIRERICAEHRECCQGCESCHHHHGEEAGSGSAIFVSGRGQFFRVKASVDLAEVRKVSYAAAPVLFVHTDRPVYKAGDTMRFRGILRVPRTSIAATDESRFEPAAGREVTLSIQRDAASLFRRTYVTGEHGTFSGEFELPLTAARAEHAITVEHAGGKVSQAFEVMDYRKSEFAVILTPGRGEVLVQAGTVWGAPVADTVLRCTLDGRPVEPKDGRIALKDGQRLKAVLLRGEEELARKSLTFRAASVEPPAADEKPAAEAARAEGSAPAKAEPAEKPALRITPSKPRYGRGEWIEAAIAAPWDETEALVAAADTHLYDVVRVELVDGRGVVRLPVRPVYDPGVTLFLLCGGKTARADVGVRTQAMKVDIDAPAQARPGQEVAVTLKGEPGAAFAFSAVDEAIYMLREDDTPPMYDAFHKPRPAALAYARFGDPEWDGEKRIVDPPPSHACFKDLEKAGDRVFRGLGVYETIGGGGGGGGRYGTRMGGRKMLVAVGGGGGATEDAVLASLDKGLARLQKPDGSWSSTWVCESGTLNDVGATSLALLGWLGAGYSHLSKDVHGGICFGDVVRKALQWLMARQDPSGVVGARDGDWIFNHTLAALALSEAYGLTGSDLFKDAAARAVEAVGATQSANGGWHPSDRSRKGTPATSVWAVLALRSAQIAALPLPPTAPANAWRFFDAEIDEDGVCGAPATRTTTAAGMLAILHLRSDKSDPRLGLAARELLRELPDWNRPDLLGWHLASLALFSYDGPSGPVWKRWIQPLKDTLVRNQRKDGLFAVGGETIATTALGTLALQVYYRYANVFGVKGKNELPPLAPAPRIRIHFPDTALWEPELTADGRGEARVSFTLPDTVTTTRLTARGITKDAAVGEAVGRIAARQPFFVRIACPETVLEGDSIDVRVEVYNHTPGGLEASVRLEGQEARTVQVPADRPAVTFWTVRAEGSALRLVAHGKAAGFEDAMERTIPVRPFAREVFSSVRLKSATGKPLSFTAPEGVRDAVVRIDPARGGLAQVLDSLRWLNQYPYG